MYSVLICDDNQHWAKLLSTEIGKQPLYNVIGIAVDGKTAINQIELLHPDIIIIDIIMPEFDGAYIVDYIRNNIEGYNPLIYVISGIGTDTIIYVLNDLNIDFYSMKPVSIDVVIQNLNHAVNRRVKAGIVQSSADVSSLVYESQEEALKPSVKLPPVTDIIRDTVFRLGMPPHRISTKCVIDALTYYITNPDSARALTKVLYPEIAKKYDISESSAEKNIRNAISGIYKNKTEMFDQIFMYSNNRKVTNGEFLSVVSDFIIQRSQT